MCRMPLHFHLPCPYRLSSNESFRLSLLLLLRCTLAQVWPPKPSWWPLLFAFIFDHWTFHLPRKTCSWCRYYQPGALWCRIYRRSSSFRDRKEFHMLLRFPWTRNRVREYFGCITCFSIRMVFLGEFSVLLCYLLSCCRFRYFQNFIVSFVIHLLRLSWIRTHVQSSSSWLENPPPKGKPPNDEKKLITLM